MAIALELIDLEGHHYDKNMIDPLKVCSLYVRESLMAWLPQHEWKGFHSLMVSTTQLLVESTRLSAIKQIIQRKFSAEDKKTLLAMVDDIVLYFAVADGLIEWKGESTLN